MGGVSGLTDSTWQRLADRVGEYTVWPAGSDGGPHVDHVLVVPPGQPLADAFERAQVLLDQDRRVRIVGYGVVDGAQWPGWVRSASSLSLTELGFYEGRTRMAASRPLMASMRDWCRSVFGAVVPEVDSASIFASAAVSRLAQPVLDTAAVVEGLVALHPKAVIEAVSSDWPGLLLVARARLRGPGAPGWRLLLPPVVGAGLVRTLVRFAKEYVKSAPARARAEKVRTTTTPKLWLALIPDWARANNHLLAATAANGTAELGVLFAQNFGIGTRDDQDQSVKGDRVWSGLGPFAEAGSVALEQLVMPTSVSELVAELVMASGHSALATARVLAHGPPPFVSGRFEMELAKLLTVDLFRARLARAATLKATPRLREHRAPIVFCAANTPPMATAERLLAQQGLVTAEYLHGIGNDAWHGTAESDAALRFVWTHSDAAALAPNGQPTRVAGLPVPSVERRPDGWRHVLILTNYYHRDLFVNGRPALRGPYQKEILGIASQLRSSELRFRWRPHPSERREFIERAHEPIAARVELSSEPEYSRDLQWADIVISSHSSTVVEAIFAGYPVFVHLRPELIDSPFVNYVQPERRFTRAAEAVPRIEQCIRLLREGRYEEALAPERAAKEALVGASARPQPLRDAVAVWERAERGSPAALSSAANGASTR